MRACILNTELRLFSYALANKSFNFESDVIYGAPSVYCI
jgi:hypothetical protein